MKKRMKKIYGTVSQFMKGRGLLGIPASFLFFVGIMMSNSSGCVLDIWLNEPEMPECLKKHRKAKELERNAQRRGQVF